MGESSLCKPCSVSCGRSGEGRSGLKEVELLGRLGKPWVGKFGRQIPVQEFPMYVVRMRDFLEMKAVLPHEELKAQGILVLYTEQLGPALFISHQWCRSHHPDPDFEQMKVLQEALRNILSGEVNLGISAVASILFGMGKGLNEVQAQDLHSAYIWYDYFAVPQCSIHASQSLQDYKKENHPATEMNDFRAAVRSIPSYVDRCNYFIILAPTILRPDLEDLLDYSTWCSRGWCRVERLVMHIAFNKTPVILVRASHQVSLMPGFDYFQNPPGLGSFSMESDKGLVRELLDGVVLRQLEKLLDQGKLHHYRMLMSLREALFEGLGNGRSLEPPSIVALIESAAVKRSEALIYLDTFLLKYGFGSPCEKDEAGWTPLHYAAVAGDSDIMRSLIALQADVSGALLSHDADFCVLAGHTPIALSIRFSRNVVATRCLLLSGVSANEAVTLRGFVPLHGWAQIGSSEVLDCLVAFRADLNNSNNRWGFGPAHLAACLGAPSGVGLLIKARASASSSSSALTPLHLASMNSSSGEAHARMLMEAGCAVDARVDLGYDNPLGFLVGAGTVLHSLGHAGNLSKWAFHSAGATAYFLAMTRGNFGFAQGLLEARADPQIKNYRGFTAFEAAELHGFRLTKEWEALENGFSKK
ncbi:unnamed protein product [Polarella glacialis]|uniref:Uncharacterized protein n=1 Tax=Polarella glacialis TaxID=89957 RepID=A0A813JWV2_POLGL|nr:unnamed protein product [Polarella glacialis]CAE8705431.1 unnamed protein product [Polarella glacialis]